MNRSILIVICDFLLLSLLTFSTDLSKVAGERARPAAPTLAATNNMDSGKDLAAVMRLALEDEQRRRELLAAELSRTRATAGEREQQVQTIQQEQARLQQQFAAAQTNVQTLSEQLRTSSTEATISKEKLAAMEAELKKRAEEAAKLQQQLAQLSQSNQVIATEKQRLAGELKVAEVEKRYATEQAAHLQEEVKVERAEKAKLAEGVKALATNSTQLVQEIRENRPLAPNTIFSDFLTNRVRATFIAFRSGLIDTNRRRETATVLATDGTNTYALCHVEDTPVTLWSPGTQWERLTGALQHAAAEVPVHAMSFHLQDPRVVFMPLKAEEARQLGCKAYHISNTPFKFQDAVLVGAGEGYYGECKFEIDLSTPEYVKLDRSFLRGLFGKFNPSRGDLVFSRTGELLGIMANNTYCLLLHNFDACATFQFGSDVRAQRTGDTLAALYGVVMQKPMKLQ